MPTPLRTVSTLTDRYQTTVPETVRRALHLGKRDKICYTIQPGGEVLLSRATSLDENDPVLEHFLDFLAADLSRHPERLAGIDAALVGRLQTLVGGAAIDLVAPLSEDEE